MTRDESGPRTLGGYQVLFDIKSGGMGTVSLARKTGAGGFEKLVALKTMRQEFRGRDEVRSMFLDEAKLVARLDHPAVAQVYDFGEENDQLYLAMEYVEGIPFSSLVDLSPPPEVALAAMAEVCGGLHAAHELSDLAGNPLGVVHRDVTPENLMLSYAGKVKILDFGIALVRGRQAPVTELGTIKGKPPYLSPEQLKGETIDRRTDVFAAGVVLWELLTGEYLFLRDSVYAVAHAIQSDEVPPPSAKIGALPEGLDEIVLTALARDPNKRFQTADAFGRALHTVAKKCDGESLTDFAKRALVERRQHHRAHLNSLISRVNDSPTGKRRGRAVGVHTEPAMDAVDPASLAAAPSSPAFEDDQSLTPSQLAAITPKRRYILPLLGLFVAGGALTWTMVGMGNPNTVATAEDIDAHSVDAHRDVPTDAAQPNTPDALPDAIVTTARSSKTKRSREPRSKRPQPTPDATRTIDAPAPPAVPQGSGFLRITAKPFANILIDGKPVGPTPLLRYRIPAGEHTITLIHPETNRVLRTRKVSVKAGKTHPVSN